MSADQVRQPANCSQIVRELHSAFEPADKSSAARHFSLVPIGQPGRRASTSSAISMGPSFEENNKIDYSTTTASCNHRKAVQTIAISSVGIMASIVAPGARLIEQPITSTSSASSATSCWPPTASTEIHQEVALALLADPVGGLRRALSCRGGEPNKGRSEPTADRSAGACQAALVLSGQPQQVSCTSQTPMPTVTITSVVVSNSSSAAATPEVDNASPCARLNKIRNSTGEGHSEAAGEPLQVTGPEQDCSQVPLVQSGQLQLIESKQSALNSHRNQRQVRSNASNRKASNGSPNATPTIASTSTCGDILAIKEQRIRDKNKRLGQTNRKLLFMVVLFVFSWLPLNMFNLIQDYSETISELPYIKHVFLIVHLIACSSVCYNPILYAWMSDNYRQELNDLMPKSSSLAGRCCALARSFLFCCGRSQSISRPAQTESAPSSNRGGRLASLLLGSCLLAGSKEGVVKAPGGSLDSSIVDTTLDAQRELR